MNKAEFDKQITDAAQYERVDYSGFWRGYRRGLCRFYHDEYGTAAEHDKWMDAANADNMSHKSHGLGYRAGFAGKKAKTIFDRRKGMMKR